MAGGRSGSGGALAAACRRAGDRCWVNAAGRGVQNSKLCGRTRRPSWARPWLLSPPPLLPGVHGTRQHADRTNGLVDWGVAQSGGAAPLLVAAPAAVRIRCTGRSVVRPSRACCTDESTHSCTTVLIVGDEPRQRNTPQGCLYRWHAAPAQPWHRHNHSSVRHAPSQRPAGVAAQDGKGGSCTQQGLHRRLLLEPRWWAVLVPQRLTHVSRHRHRPT